MLIIIDLTGAYDFQHVRKPKGIHSEHKLRDYEQFVFKFNCL